MPPKKANRPKRQAEDAGNLSLKKLVSDFRTTQKAEKIAKQPTEEELKALLEPMMSLIEEKMEKQKQLTEKFQADITALLKEKEKSLQKTKEDNAPKLARMRKKSVQQSSQRESKTVDDLHQASAVFYQGFDEVQKIQRKFFEDLESPFYKKTGKQNEKLQIPYKQAPRIEKE